MWLEIFGDVVGVAVFTGVISVKHKATDGIVRHSFFICANKHGAHVATFVGKKETNWMFFDFENLLEIIKTSGFVFDGHFFLSVCLLMGGT